MSETRKLAAILAADVVGYSRLAGAEEDRTLARFRALRSDLIDPTVAVHHGRVVKRTGDGILVEFRSVVDAVRCAVEVQNGMVERNAGLPPDRCIEFRIGIHLGDVVEESDGDLMGDGVNIAARVEGIANPGAICLSEDAYRQVSGRLDMEVTDLGQTQLKNIEKSIRAYSLQVGVPAQAKPTKAGAPKQRSMFMLLGAAVVALIVIGAGARYFLGANRTASVASSVLAPAQAASLSIVVLPFANSSGDPSQDFLADVLTDELTTYMSRLPGSFVIAQNTAFTYKGKPTDVKQIGKDLGVRYALEGSVQPTGNRVRVNAQLVDTETGAYLSAEEFDHERGNLLQMQDDIVTRLASTLRIQLIDMEAAQLQRAHPANPDAQELALRCEASLLADFSSRERFHLCEQALEIDPNNVTALAWLSVKFYLPALTSQSADRQADIKRADELVSRALAIDPNSSAAHFAKASVLLAQGQFEEARAEAERTIELDPSAVGARTALCVVDLYTGQPEAVIACIDKAISLSPRDPSRNGLFLVKGEAYLMLGRDDEAVELLRRSVTADPKFALAYLYLSGGLAMSGHKVEAHDALTRYLSLPRTRTKTIAEFKKQPASDNPTYMAMLDRVYEGLRKAGMPEE
jgi:adenylate cyclase